jgi:hypothetical protein
MRTLLLNEIKNEMPNSQALGAFNEVVRYSDTFQGQTNTFKVEKNKYGITVATRYNNGVKTNFSRPLQEVANNLRKG